MSDTPPPMPSSPTDGKPAGKLTHATNMVRNVIVSVTSTVLGATLIYFLGFQHRNSSSDNPLEIKEATTKAWRSYVTSENLYYKNMLSLMKDLGANKKLNEYREGVLKESEKFTTDLPEILKDKNVDPAFVTMIHRRMDNEKTNLVKEKGYLDRLQNILDGNYSQEEKSKKLNEEDNDWAIYSRGAYERAVTDVEDLAKTLSERFGQPFAMTDLLVYTAMKDQAKQQEKNNNQTTDNPTDQKKDNGAPADPGTTDNPNNAENANVVKTNPDPVVENVNRRTNGNEISMSNLAGVWDTYMAGIDLYQNGTMYWTPDNAEETSGTWKVVNNQLVMYPSPNSYIPQNTTWVFNISGLTSRGFTMTLTTTPYNRYVLTRAQN